MLIFYYLLNCNKSIKLLILIIITVVDAFENLCLSKSKSSTSTEEKQFRAFHTVNLQVFKKNNFLKNQK